MLDRLFGPQTNNLQRALGRTTQRHSLLTENLANVNVPGYKRKDMDFGIQLETAESLRAGRSETLQSSSLATSTSQGSVRIDGNSVDLEQEIASLGETELRYQMLTEMTSRHFSGLKTVIREGR